MALQWFTAEPSGISVVHPKLIAWSLSHKGISDTDDKNALLLSK